MPKSILHYEFTNIVFSDFTGCLQNVRKPAKAIFQSPKSYITAVSIQCRLSLNIRSYVFNLDVLFKVVWYNHTFDVSILRRGIILILATILNWMSKMTLKFLQINTILSYVQYWIYISLEKEEKNLSFKFH